MQRPAVVHFHYELVSEDGEVVGTVESEESAFCVGDFVPCGGHMFEVRTVDEATLHVRKVI